MENAEFENRFLLDYYLWFGCTVLAHQSRVLNEAHAAEDNADRRRAYFVSIHTNLIQEGAHGIHAHQPCDSVLATGLSGLPQVQEYARGAVDALTRGRYDAERSESSEGDD